MSMSDVVNVGGVRCVYTDCITCGIRYTVPEAMWDKQQEQGGMHSCPNGHRQGWTLGENTEIDNIRRERDRLKQRIARKDDEINAQRDLRERAERSAASYKGQVTRLKKRASAGVCPCCNRHFTNLERHMESKHPDFAAEDTAA